MSFIYWPLVLRSGVLPPEADSIAIPMFNDLLVAVVLTPFVLGTAWLCLRRYNCDVRLVAWRRDRPIRSLVASLVLGGAAGALAALLVIDTRSDWPWYEHLWAGCSLLWLWWFLALRGAFVEQLDADETA